MKDEYKIRLKEFGISPTVQRVMILEYLDKSRIHPSAEEVYQGLRDKVVSLSKATVYNTLNKFAEVGIVHTLTLFENETRYEYNLAQHIHFKCVRCGKIIDVQEENALHQIKYVENHKILEYQLNLRGICIDCLTDEEKDS